MNARARLRRRALVHHQMDIGGVGGQSGRSLLQPLDRKRQLLGAQVADRDHVLGRMHDHLVDADGRRRCEQVGIAAPGSERVVPARTPAQGSLAPATGTCSGPRAPASRASRDHRPPDAAHTSRGRPALVPFAKGALFLRTFVHPRRLEAQRPLRALRGKHDLQPRERVDSKLGARLPLRLGRRSARARPPDAGRPR